MEPYKNSGGSSGVRAYEIGNDYIVVEFRDSSQYLYNNIRPGTMSVERMKMLALRGQGLNSFISVSVKKNYYQKLK